ncbi:MAG: 3-dehydroquinate synthase [Bacteriovoracaceae bacterium]
MPEAIVRSNIESLEWTEIESQIRSLETDTVILIIDQVVWNLYSRMLKPLLKIDGKKVIFWKSPDGEKVKTFEQLESCLEFCLERKAHRNSQVVAIGGGAVSDFAGFVASSLLRGVKWNVVPTTLLSMTDASIGGKVAINSAYGKNLVGAFHLPMNVWIDKKFLETLPDNHLQSGKGELLKYCFLSKEVYDAVVENGFDEKLISLCAQYKEEITKEDFKESGLRKVLNLGHTLGHAVERIYGIEHGEAVFWGMALVFIIFDDEKYIEDLKSLSLKIGVDYKTPPWFQKTFPLAKILEYVANDKKVISSGNVEFILVDEIGKPTTSLLSLSELESKIKDKNDVIRFFRL